MVARVGTQVGSKLLYAEMRISARLVGCLLKGNALSRCGALSAENAQPARLPLTALCCLRRRERKQLTRTTADMFRLVPLLVIVVRCTRASCALDSSADN